MLINSNTPSYICSCKASQPQRVLFNARMAWCFLTGRHNIWMEKKGLCLTIVTFLLPDKKCLRSADVNARVIKAKTYFKEQYLNIYNSKNLFIIIFRVLGSIPFNLAPTLRVYLRFKSFYDVNGIY